MPRIAKNGQIMLLPQQEEAKALHQEGQAEAEGCLSTRLVLPGCC